MANIFRSKEIYKKINTGPEKTDTAIVPVKGMYVVGDYSPPHLIQPITLITDIRSKKATVVDYKHVYKNAYSEEQSCANFLSIKLANKPNISKYSQKNISAYSEEQSCANFLSIKLMDTLHVNKYTRAYTDTYSEEQSCANFLSITRRIDPQVTKFYKQQHGHTEPSIRVTRLNTIRAEVVDVIVMKEG